MGHTIDVRIHPWSYISWAGFVSVDTLLRNVVLYIRYST